MKRILSALAMGTMLFAASQPATATIWRLNNSNGGAITPNINASFPTSTTLQQAHDNSSVLAGDTIHVEQSNTSYGNLTMTKRLTIIGGGFFLSMNPKTQVNTAYGSTVGSINMNASTCAGSTITGLTITGTVYMGASRLILTRNYITGGYGAYLVYIGGTSTTAVDSTIITQNYMSTGQYAYSISEQNGTGNLTNLIISNNYIYAYNYSTIYTTGRSSGMIKNNVIDGTAMSVNNMYIVNNIQKVGTTNTFNNCLIEYNLGASNGCFVSPSGSGNTFTSSSNLTNSTQGFVVATSYDSTLMLQSSSPAKGTGKSGDDMGMFGGTMPYVLSGIPTVPNVYALSIGTVAAGATSISVTVSTKSN